ncbi:MAG: bifunctional riboflavin kinase/FAD synthetase [Agathobacter sp.]|nr:bifunctional riboflavin kinase/FAD synthetase [Agathobacter sp.]
MKHITKTLDFKVEEPTAVTLGKFDGLHRGHELLMQNVLKCKKEYQVATVAFTFDMPPRNRVEDIVANVLTTNDEKQYIFEKQGIDYLIECPFTKEVMSMEPDVFIEWIAHSLNMKYVVVGDDFHFGHNRAGNYHTLQAYEEKYGYKTIVLEKLKDSNRDISSTYVREMIADGNIQKANELLGYDYFILSEILHGKKLGRRIGIPTINMILPENKLLPPNGVYLTEVLVQGKKYMGVTNVGCKPTVSEERVVGVETYIDQFNQDIYGEKILVSFLEYIRPELKFDSIEELKAQMETDICIARKCYKNITQLC